MASSASESEINERLLRNVKKEVKQIMEESVTRKFVHEESSTITALCSAVEACLQYGLRKRSLGLFKNSNTTTALLQKIGKTFEPASRIVRSLAELEKNLENSRKSVENGSPSSKQAHAHKYNCKYLWIRLALFEKQLAKIVEYLVENNSKFYDKDVLMSDPVDGMILASLLVGPCALDYTRMKTADHYWTDPPADELVQRHRIHSSNHYIPAQTDSPKRPGLQVHRTVSSSSDEPNCRQSSSMSAKEYVESLHQNAKSTLLYGKNNVIIQPKEDVEPLAGYLSLHQNADGLTLKWTPNQLMNGGGSEDDDSVVDRRPIYAKYAAHRRLVSSRSNRRNSFWDYAIAICMDQIVYLHCHQQPDHGGLVVLVGQDGVQRPPIHFPKGGHLLAFLSCLENGLLPRGQLDPPLWSQRGKGKVFPKLKRKTGPAGVLSSLIGSSVTEESTSSATSSLSSVASVEDGKLSADDEGNEALDYVFRVVYMPRPDPTTGEVVDPKLLKSKPSDEANGAYEWLATFVREVPVQPAVLDSVQPFCEFDKEQTVLPVCTPRMAVKQLCDTMKWQILSRAFYGWLSHCRHLKTVRTHLSGLVHPVIVSIDHPIDASRGVTLELWKEIASSGSFEQREVELYRLTYYGGCDPDIRREVWPYLLGYYKFDSSESSRLEQDEASRQQYEHSMSEWLAIEAIITQRDRETSRVPQPAAEEGASRLRFSDSQDGGNGVDLPSSKVPLFRKDSSLSNDVFESVDGPPAGIISGCDEASRPETVVEESSSATTPTMERSSVATDNGGLPEPGTDANHCIVNKPRCSEQNPSRCTEHRDGSLSPDDGLGSSIAPTRMSALSDSSRRVDSCDTDRGTDEIKPENVTSACDVFEGGQGHNILVTGATVDCEGTNVSEINGVVGAEDSTVSGCLDEDDHRLSASQESLICPASPISNTSNGGVYSAELLDNVALNIHRIDKDVHRCDRNNVYFTSTSNLDKLRNIMCTYVWENLEVGYIQGMCDLLAPILVIFDDEVKAYTCFCYLMKRMSINFPQGGAMDQHFGNMRSLIQILDPELFEHMRQNGDYTHFYFCYRWFLLDFKRELVYDDVFLVWETIWSAKQVSSPHFVLFIALALVEYYREIIIDNNMDFTDIIKFFNEMAERHNAKEVLQIARCLVHRLQDLIENK